jgi:hypothetical protein
MTLTADERRALKLLASDAHGATEDFLVLAHGFTREMLARLVLSSRRHDDQGWAIQDHGRRQDRDRRLGCNRNTPPVLWGPPRRWSIRAPVNSDGSVKKNLKPKNREFDLDHRSTMVRLEKFEAP